MGSIGIEIPLISVDAWLEEAGSELVFTLYDGASEVRERLNDLHFARKRKSGELRIIHADGSITPARCDIGLVNGGKGRTPS